MAAPTLAPGLQRKLRKVLDTKTESSDVASSLATLSTFYTGNTTSSRRHLRSTIENEALKVNEDFLKAVQDVTVALDAVQADLDATAQRCDRMTTHVSNTRSTTCGVLQESERLQHALETSRARSELLSTFRQCYQLSREEAEALQADTIDDRFFAALDHVLQIHTNCKALLRTHHQRAGLELLDSMASLQEAAYERLCRWVRERGQALAESDAPEVDPLLQRAAAALRPRPVLHAYCAEEVAAARQGAVFQRFIRALTRGARPIEMHAPDPWRYASDMLAWVHTSLASERELFVTLFGNDGDGAGMERKGGDGDGKAMSSHADTAPLIPRMLDTVFESVCRPLRVRLEQVLLSSPPPLLCFRLSQLLAFYLTTVDSLLGSHSQLSESLRACRAMALRTFNETLKHRGDKLARFPPPPPYDLSLPQQLAEGAALASDLVEGYEGSLTSVAAGDVAAEDNDFDAVLATVLDPLVAAIERSSEALNPTAAARVDEGSHLDPSDQRVYVINCLQALQRPLRGHACAAKRADALAKAVSDNMLALVAGEVRRTLSSCGLADITERFESYAIIPQAAPPASDPSLTLPRVAEAMQTFFGKLSDPAALPEFRKLQAPHIKTQAIQHALDGLAKAYAHVYESLSDPINGYAIDEVLREVRHTPEQVKTLLGVNSSTRS